MRPEQRKWAQAREGLAMELAALGYPPELADLQERFDRCGAGMPDRSRLLWFLDFMAEWFGEFPEGTQDRFYNIHGL